LREFGASISAIIGHSIRAVQDAAAATQRGLQRSDAIREAPGAAESFEQPGRRDLVVLLVRAELVDQRDNGERRDPGTRLSA
jgi:hypothetical protein